MSRNNKLEYNAYMRAYYAENREHLTYLARERYRDRIKNGLCPRCPAELDDEFCMCSACRQRAKDNKWLRNLLKPVQKRTFLPPTERRYK